MEKILIIDDSKVTQSMLTEVFLDSYDLEFRDDGLSGIAAAVDTNPDLILLDIHMPGIDGFEVCKTLKSAKETRNIPVIFITSFDAEKEKVKGFESGADDYVVKPFYPQELQARVKAHLASHRSRKQSLEMERLAVFKELAVALCHEINNPLTTIFAYLHVLQVESSNIPESSKQIVAGIRTEVKRIHEVTGRLLQATKAVKTNYTSEIEMIDLHNI